MTFVLYFLLPKDAAGPQVHEGFPGARAGRAGLPAVGRGLRAGPRRPHPQVEAAHAQLGRLQAPGLTHVLTQPFSFVYVQKFRSLWKCGV